MAWTSTKKLLGEICIFFMTQFKKNLTPDLFQKIGIIKDFQIFPSLLPTLAYNLLMT